MRLQHVYWNSEFKLEPGTQVCNDVYNNENHNPHCDGKIYHAMLTSSSTKHQVNMSLGGSTCDSRASEATFSLLFQVKKVVVVIFGDFIS